MIHFSEPEARALISERAYARKLQYLAGEIGEATFLRSLLLDGTTLDEAKQALFAVKSGALP